MAPTGFCIVEVMCVGCSVLALIGLLPTADFLPGISQELFISSERITFGRLKHLILQADFNLFWWLREGFFARRTDCIP